MAAPMDGRFWACSRSPPIPHSCIHPLLQSPAIRMPQRARGDRGGELRPPAACLRLARRIGVQGAGSLSRFLRVGRICSAQTP